MNNDIDTETLNILFTILANFVTEEHSREYEIKEEYKERALIAQHSHELEIENMKSAVNKSEHSSKIYIAIIKCLCVCLIFISLIFGIVLNNTIQEHLKQDVRIEQHETKT